MSQNLIIKNLGYGTTVHGIRLKELKNLKIFIPKIEEQKKIAKIISNIYDFIDNSNLILKKYYCFKNSIQRDVFNKFNLVSY